MKKLVMVILVVASGLQLAACANPKVIDGVEYRPYGLLNEEERKNPNIEYEVVVGNVFWSIILCETIIAPIYFVGFSIKQPVGKKLPDDQKH